MTWPILKLSELCSKISVGHVGTTSEFYTDEKGVPFLRTQNISSSGLDLKDVMYVTHEFHAKLKKSQLHPGDIVISRVISTRVNCAIIPEDLNVSNCANIILVSPKKNVLDANYLNHYFRSPSVQRDLLKRQVGSAQAVVNTSVIKDWFIPLPPLEEQKRIATILDKADSIRQKRQQAIALADDFLRSVFLDMFGDPVTNPKGWELLKFSELGSLDRGKSKHRPRNDPKLLGGKHPLIQTGDVANSKGYITEFGATYSDFGLDQSRKWATGTLCITIAANIAKTGILTFDACFPDSVVGFSPNSKTTVEFIQHWLGFLQKTLEENAPESAQKNINLKILRDLNVPVPPVEQQKLFSSIVVKTLGMNGRVDMSSKELDLSFLSLSKKAFSGQL